MAEIIRLLDLDENRLGDLGGGVNLGASVDAGLSIQVTNAQTISDLKDVFLNAS